MWKNRGAMKKWMAMAVLAVAGLGAGCFRNVETTVELRVPEMTDRASALRVERALKGLDRNGSGNIREVVPDIGNGVVRVRYNNVELGLKNLQMAVMHAGYAVDELPADEAARAKWSKGE